MVSVKNKRKKQSKKIKSEKVKTKKKPSIIIISKDEYKQRNDQHQLCVQAAEVVEKIFQDLKEEYETNVKLEKEELQWNRYVDCYEIPNIENKMAIRTYLYKWLFDEWQVIKSAFTWVLDIDERSILTQDFTKPNLTRRNLELKPTPQKVLSETCGNHIRKSLKMLDELRMLFEDEEKKVKFEELLEVKAEIENRMRNCIDNLTYFILINTDGNMKSIDIKSERYSNRYDGFSMDVWSMKDVPWDFTQTDLTELNIRLEAVRSTVVLPINLANEHLVIRGLHMSFDLRSPIEENSSLKVGALKEVRDSKTVLLDEKQMRKDIETEKLEQMRKERQQYEDDLKAKEEASKQNAKRKRAAGEERTAKPKGKKGKKQKSERTLEPPIQVTKETFLDVEKDFLELDDREYENYKIELKMQHPELKDNEINLQTNLLLAGVYEFHFVEKPIQRLMTNNMYLCLKQMPEKLRYKENECFAENENLKADSKFILSKNVDAPIKGSENNLPLKSPKEYPEIKSMIKITVKIPSHLCKWSRPKTCRWTSKLRTTAEGQQRSVCSSKPTLTQHTIANLQKSLYFTTRDQVLPRIGSYYKFTDELAAEDECLKAQAIEADRARREEALADPKVKDADDETGVIATVKTKEPAEKFIVQINPPAHLFPRWMSRNYTKLMTVDKLKDVLRNDATIMRCVDSSELEDFVEEVERQAEIKKTSFFAWWDLVKNAEEKMQKENAESLQVDNESNKIEPVKSPTKKKGQKDTASVDGRTSLSRQSTTENRISGRKEPRKGKVLKDASRKINEAKDSKNRMKIDGSKLAKPRIDVKPTRSMKDSLDSSKETRDETEVGLDKLPRLQRISAGDEIYNYDSGVWSTEHIFKEEYDDETSEMTFWTDRLGIFGFAFNKYLHYPLKDWCIYPKIEQSSTVIILEILSQFVHIAITIGEDGYKANVTPDSIVYSKLAKGTEDIGAFQANLRDLGLNIFSDQNTCLYLTDMYEKPTALESEAYKTISEFSQRFKFSRSKWNWLAHRRVMLLKFGTIKQQTYEMNTIHVTPEEAQFCSVTETCTPLDEVVLEYTPLLSNKVFKPNLYFLLCSCLNKSPPKPNPKLQILVYNLLKAIRPLSFCK